MANALRREGGRSSAPGVFSATGTLAGITGPGRRPVTTLQLRRFGPGEDLSVLATFTDLERLEFHHVNGVDLAPLAGFGLKELVIKKGSHLDLSPVNDLPALEWLGLSDIDHVHIPPLALPATLRTLAIVNGDPMLTGIPVKQAIEAIQWHRLTGLHALGLRVGGVQSMPPIEVDLGFLHHLTALDHLELHAGVHHVGPGASPLEPPFDGLSRNLTFIRIDAWDPEEVHAALGTYLGTVSDVAAGITVDRRVPWEVSELGLVSGQVDAASYDNAGAADEEYADDPSNASDAWHPRHDVDPALLPRLDVAPETAGDGSHSSAALPIGPRHAADPV